ncbi:hypothetical protein HKD37_09G025341 [Glycine soja]
MISGLRRLSKSCPHRKKLRTYLGIVARDKVNVTYENWKQVHAAQKDLIWEDIQAEFDITEAFDLRTKKKILQTVGERWRQLSQNRHLQLTRKVSTTLYAKSMTLARRSRSNFVRPAETLGGRMCERRHMPSRNKTLPLMCCLVGTTREVEDDPHQENWANDDSLEKQTSQGSFVAHGCQDVLTAVIGRLEHPGRVRATGAGVTIKKYFGPAPRTSCTSSSMAPEDLEQLTQQIRDHQMQSQFQLQMQSHGLAPPPELEVGPSVARVRTNESCVDPSGNDLDMGDSDKYGLYVKENPSRLGVVGPMKPADRPDHDVMWDATVFRVFNENFPLYIKHEDLSEITHGVCEWGMPMCMDSSSHSPSRDLGNLNLNQKVTLRTRCRIQNRIALKGLDDTPQSKSKAAARWIVVKTIETREIEGASHPMGKVLFES